MSRLDDVERRCAEATEGPWENDQSEVHAMPGYEWVAETLDDENTTKTDRNAAFIAHARTDLPDLARDFRTVAEAVHLAAYEYRNEWGTGEPDEETPYDAALALCDRWLKDQEGD